MGHRITENDQKEGDIFRVVFSNSSEAVWQYRSPGSDALAKVVWHTMNWVARLSEQ